MLLLELVCFGATIFVPGFFMFIYWCMDETQRGRWDD